VRWFAAAALAGIVTAVAAAVGPPPAAPPALTAAEIIEKNIAARGGLEGWSKVQTMVWMGHIEGANASAPAMPFVLELKRPNMTHFEIMSLKEKYSRIFDGSRGWKLRPNRNGGGQDVQAFSPEEVNFSRDEFVIDGPLVDYQAKGVAVNLDGVDEVEGRRAYRLSLKLPSGANRRVWIDAETYLDIRYDRPSSNPLTRNAAVSVYYRNYTTVDGLQIPLSIERGAATGAAAGNAPEKLRIDRVLVNPPLEDRAFAKPGVPRKQRATVNLGGDVPPIPRVPGGPSR
jgi:hypothetical protein